MRYYESIGIFGKSSVPMFNVEIVNGNIVRIDVYSNILKCHFYTKQYTDFKRYIQLNQKQLNEIGFNLINNKENWIELNKIHNLLFDIYINHLKKYFDDDGCLSEKAYHYQILEYRCLNNDLKTVDDINRFLGVYASLI